MYWWTLSLFFTLNCWNRFQSLGCYWNKELQEHLASLLKLQDNTLKLESRAEFSCSFPPCCQYWFKPPPTLRAAHNLTGVRELTSPQHRTFEPACAWHHTTFPPGQCKEQGYPGKSNMKEIVNQVSLKQHQTPAWQVSHSVPEPKISTSGKYFFVYFFSFFQNIPQPLCNLVPITKHFFIYFTKAFVMAQWGMHMSLPESY